jgi:hypothetical protein
MVLGARGHDCVWAELPDGRTCHLALAWTDRCPRAAPLRTGVGPVRLAPDGLNALAAWVAARTREREKLARRADYAENRVNHGVGDIEAPGRAPADAVVGIARGRARALGDPRARDARGLRMQIWY